ncbi:MAG: SDR family NAD(P)-dependent oxidoreductase [Pseudomonadales bacterium]
MMDDVNKQFEGQVALVTGACSGIGLASAQRFSAQGATVVGIDLNSSASWDSFAAANSAVLHQVDVTDEAAVVKVVAETLASFGRIDILMTAAGVGEAGPLNMLDIDAWRRVIDINLTGTAIPIKAVLEPMLEQRSGSIITVASIEGTVGTEGGSAYNAAKGGVVLLSKNVAMDYGRMGIRCNCICPGFIDTPMLRSLLFAEGMEEFRDSILGQIKMGRFGKPEEIASAAAFLASTDASYMTGQNLIMDGGYTAGHSHGVVQMLGLT